MFINTYEPKNKRFKDLLIGETFYFNYELYVKIDTFRYNNVVEQNAFNFNMNETVAIYEESLVEPVDVFVEVVKETNKNTFRAGVKEVAD